MRIFVYEYLTANGIGREPGSPEHGMYLEGRAMRDAVVADFERISFAEPFAFPDKATPVEQKWVEEVARFSDWTLVIAPEFGGTLFNLAHSVQSVNGQLLGPSLDAIQLTSNKLALAEHWRTHSIRTPATTDCEPTPCELFPVVWKPRDGAGSTNTFLIRDAFELAQAIAGDPRQPMILQEFVPGRAASVAFLCGPRTQLPLLPTFQLLSDGQFQYRGGELPIPSELAARAVELASRAVKCVSGLLGYVGVDLVLGDAKDGSRDYAIEINPRLTTSYIGLRTLAACNLAEVMLKVARGEDVDALKWKNGQVRFTPEGSIQSF